jgi:pyruvate,orthophosphate dikinase
MPLGFSRDDLGNSACHTSRTISSKTAGLHCSIRPAVGQLMQIALDKARKSGPDIMLGICGEDGGDPRA